MENLGLKKQKRAQNSEKIRLRKIKLKNKL